MVVYRERLPGTVPLRTPELSDAPDDSPERRFWCKVCGKHFPTLIDAKTGEEVRLERASMQAAAVAATLTPHSVRFNAGRPVQVGCGDCLHGLQYTYCTAVGPMNVFSKPPPTFQT